jgi:hypothetical protein
MAEPNREQEHKDNLHPDPNKALEGNRAIAALAMRGANPRQKAIVYCCYGGITAVILVLSVPPYEASKQIVAVGLLMLFLLIMARFVGVRYTRLSAQQPPQKLRRTVRLSQPMVNHVRSLLDDARKIAYDFLKGTNPELLDHQVRANIFFPEYDPVDPTRYRLRIYPGLHVMMEHSPELNITLDPGQGLTGNVFTSGQNRVTQRLASGSRDWDRIFAITDDLAAVIHPDLQWIISIVLEGQDGAPIGVMNVDGLQHQFPIDVLYKCVGILTIQGIIISEFVSNALT